MLNGMKNRRQYENRLALDLPLYIYVVCEYDYDKANTGIHSITWKRVLETMWCDAHTKYLHVHFIFHNLPRVEIKGEGVELQHVRMAAV